MSTIENEQSIPPATIGPMKGNDPATLHGLLSHSAREMGDRCAYTYLGTHGTSRLSYAELNTRARAIAGRISQIAQPGDRVILVFPAGLDFITSFFGCLYAGVLAVPATYPKPRRPMPRLSAIARDCDARAVLTTAQTLSTLDDARAASDLPEVEWLAVDAISDDFANECPRLALGKTDLAFLQYTSGSTSEPRGVMVSHGNLLHNLEMIRVGFGIDKLCWDGDQVPTGVFWLPAYHDMGLIGGILETLFVGGHSILMSPADFLQRPMGWVEAISKYRASISGAPNFAYEMCVARTTAEQRAQLDLSSWKIAFCGAEPIRVDTLNEFAEAFAAAKFDRKAFYPCYGLAEGTLLAAGSVGPREPVVTAICSDALKRHEVILKPAAGPATDNSAQQLVSCGTALLGQQLEIVDPESCLPCSAGQVGEIWVRGGSVAQGYWNRAEATAHTFGGYLADTHEGPYMRTGDLGFVTDGELYITGRVKDVIIIRGRNHYPQDIERTVSQANEALRHDSGAVFAVEADGTERVAIIQEVDRQYRKADFNAVMRDVRRAVAETHELEVHTIALIRHMSLPRTTSGKAQRHVCRKQLEDGELKVLADWTRTTAAQTSTKSTVGAVDRFQQPEEPLSPDEAARLAERVESWLLTWMVERAAVPKEEIDRDKPFAEYGLDSLTAVELSQELEDWLGVEVVPTVAWNYPTPATLSRYLAWQAAGLGDELDAVNVSPVEAASENDFDALLAEIEGLSDEEARALLDSDADNSGQ